MGTTYSSVLTEEPLPDSFLTLCQTYACIDGILKSSDDCTVYHLLKSPDQHSHTHLNYKIIPPGTHVHIFRIGDIHDSLLPDVLQGRRPSRLASFLARHKKTNHQHLHVEKFCNKVWAWGWVETTEFIVLNLSHLLYPIKGGNYAFDTEVLRAI